MTEISLAVTGSAGSFPWLFTGVYVVGFIAAVAIGSIAWYNSKRPPGWEGRDRPDIVPKVTDEETSASNE